MSARSSVVQWCRTLRVGAPALIAVLLGASAPAFAAPCWFPPVAGTVVDPFREPACPWCAGNRGIEYRVASTTTVRAAASGRAVFVGTVVDVRYVVVQLASGWRHTYGHVTSTRLESGDVVFADQVLGTASDTFFFGLRIGDDYADPAPYLGVSYRRPRLIPLDGTPARPAPPARARCPAPAANYRATNDAGAR